LLKNVTDLSRDLFGVTALPQDEDGLMQKFRELLMDEKQKIGELLQNYGHRFYPGKDVLEGGQKLLDELLAINDTATFYGKVREVRRELKDYASRSGLVKSFFDSQRAIYDRAADKLHIFESNRTYVSDEDLLKTVGEMEKIVKHIDPYSNIQQLPELSQSFDERFGELLSKECEPIKDIIAEDQEVVMDELDRHPDAKPIFAANIRNQFLSLKDRLDRVNNFYEAIAMQIESDRLKVRFMQDIQRKADELKLDPPAAGPIGGTISPEPSKPVKKTKTLSKMSMLRGTTKIESTEDIDRFLQDLRIKLEAELDEDTVITLV
jgi:DNA replication initiation complex subunit (GINS family)